MFDLPLGPGFVDFDLEAAFEKNRKETWQFYDAKLKEIENSLPADPDRRRPIFRPEDY